MTTQVFQRVFSEVLPAQHQYLPVLAASSQLMRALPPWIVASAAPIITTFAVKEEESHDILAVFFKFSKAMQFTQKLYISDRSHKVLPKLNDFLSRCPNLQVLHLRRGAVRDHHLDTLASCSLRFLRELKLRIAGPDHISDEGIERLLARLPALESLEIDEYHRVEHNTKKSLASIAKVLPRLRKLSITSLQLCNPSVDDEGAVELLCSQMPTTGVQRLRSLDLSAFGRLTAQNFAALGQLRFLEKLVLPIPENGNQVEEALCDAFPSFLCLRSIRFSYFSTMLKKCVAAMPATLRELRQITIGDRGLELLSERCPQLEELELSCHSVITNIGLRQIGRFREHLKSLELVPLLNAAAEDWIEALGPLTNLRWLSLSQAYNFDDSVIRAVLPNLMLLELFSVFSPGFSDDGLASCIRNGCLKNVKYTQIVFGPKTLAAMGAAKLAHLQVLNGNYCGEEHDEAGEQLCLQSLKHLRKLPSLRFVGPMGRSDGGIFGFSEDEALEAVYGDTGKKLEECSFSFDYV